LTERSPETIDTEGLADDLLRAIPTPDTTKPPALMFP
jgi:hypothetical protein